MNQTMQRLLLLLPFALLLSCGQTSQEEMERDYPTNDPVVAEDADAPGPAPANDNAGPESSVSGELPFAYLEQDDFSPLGDCKIVLSPEDFPNRYVFGFADPEGEALGDFDGRTRTLPFVSKAENGEGEMTYTHANDEYEAVTRLGRDGMGESGVVTIRRLSDGQAATFKVIGNRDC